MMKKTFVLLAVLAMAVSANAGTVTYGWEDGGVDLGTYGNIVSTSNSSDVAYSGSSSLKIVEQADSSGTPYAYVAHIENLSLNDEVTVGFWVYDSSEGVSPSGRIWGHYTENSDMTDYLASAGGNGTYSAGTGWSYLEYTWTVDNASATGLMIQARVYGVNDAIEDFIYVDDITVTAPEGAVISTPVPEPATMALLGLGSLVLARRKK